MPQNKILWLLFDSTPVKYKYITIIP